MDRAQIPHSCIADLGHSTDTVMAPRRTLILIGVGSEGCVDKGSATKLSAGATAAGFTGSSEPASVRSASITQRRSRLALIERSSAAAAMDAPGLRQAAIASALNCSLCRRRRRLPPPSSIVHTCPLLFKWTGMLLRSKRMRKVGSPSGYRPIPVLRSGCPRGGFSPRLYAIARTDGQA